MFKIWRKEKDTTAVECEVGKEVKWIKIFSGPGIICKMVRILTWIRL